MEDKEKKELLEAAKPLMLHLKKYGSPYYYAFVTQSDVEVLQSEATAETK